MSQLTSLQGLLVGSAVEAAVAWKVRVYEALVMMLKELLE